MPNKLTRRFKHLSEKRQQEISEYLSPIFEENLRELIKLILYNFNGSASRGYVQQKTGTEISKVEKALDVLVELGQVTHKTMKPDGGGRPADVYTLSPDEYAKISERKESERREVETRTLEA